MSVEVCNFQSLFQWRFRSQVPASPPAIVNPSKVVDWIQKFDARFPQLEKITKNGLYSLIDKEMQSLKPLLKEGQFICHLQPDFPQTAAMIEQLFKPRLSKLTVAFQAAQKKVFDNATVKEQDE